VRARRNLDMAAACHPADGAFEKWKQKFLDVFPKAEASRAKLSAMFDALAPFAATSKILGPDGKPVNPDA
jgi:hypothetical protein